MKKKNKTPPKLNSVHKFYLYLALIFYFMLISVAISTATDFYIFTEATGLTLFTLAQIFSFLYIYSFIASSIFNFKSRNMLIKGVAYPSVKEFDLAKKLARFNVLELTYVENKINLEIKHIKSGLGFLTNLVR